MIVSREKIFLFDTASAPEIPEGTCAFNLITDGYYWRTSNILQSDITFPENNAFTKITYSPEPGKISDEYDVLAETISSLKKFSHIITFNGNSFAFPYLRNKSAAYEICYKIDEIQSSDLYILFKSLYHLLGIPSRKLKDYLNFLEYKGTDDSAGLMASLQLAPYLDFLEGGLELRSVQKENDGIIFTFRLNKAVPERISYPFSSFYLILEGDRGKLSAKLFDGSLRVYHSDYKNYDFLINEGYAVHKSISSFMDRSKKEPAAIDNAYTLLRADGAFLTEHDLQYSYLLNTIKYLRSSL